jgi:hypothetical protein
MSDQAQSFDPEWWLRQEYLQIKPLLCLAQGVDPRRNENWPPPDEWFSRWGALKGAINDGELPANPRPANGYSTVKLEDVWDFVISRAGRGDWGWLREFCERWAEVLGITLVMPNGVDPYRTGAPGRPSISHLVMAEFERRCNEGDVLETLAAEAEVLLTWANTEHPDAPHLTAGTIENHIRSAYRQAKGKKATK